MRMYCRILMVWGFVMVLPKLAWASGEVELSGAMGFGAVAVGNTTPQFSLSPNESLVIRGEEWFFRAQNTTTFLGATGAKFGVSDTLSASGGHFWESVNLSAGLSLSGYAQAICGPVYCGFVKGFAPGAVARLDVFGSYLAGALGVTIECSAMWIDGRANATWGGFTGACSAGPLLRWMSKR